MNPTEIYEFVTNLIRDGAAGIGAFVAGAARSAVGGGAPSTTALRSVVPLPVPGRI